MLAKQRMVSEMIPRSFVLRFMPLLALGIFVVSCGTVTPGTGLSPSLLPTKTALPIRTLTPIPTREPIQLVLLHTNDDWGETEPCG
jgi:hypothetical protein